MDLALTISNREIKPQVVNFYQFENETTKLTFTLDSYMYGEVDLRNYKAYGITSINGEIDMTELETSIVDEKLVLTWDVQEYSLRQEGAILYQICFKENANDGENTAVFYSYKAIMLNRGSVDADNHITANYPTIMKQWLDRMNTTNTELETELLEKINGLAGTYAYSVVDVPYGETLDTSERLVGHLYWIWDDSTMTKGHLEDNMCNPLHDSEIYTKEEILRCQIRDRKFENNALCEFINKSMLSMVIDTFEDTSNIDASNDLTVLMTYDEERHMFEGEDVTFLFQPDTVPTDLSEIMVSVDCDDASGLTICASGNGGSTWETLGNNAEQAFSLSDGETTVQVKLEFSGSFKLYNVAWGLK